jgi:hypothetical protein
MKKGNIILTCMIIVIAISVYKITHKHTNVHTKYNVYYEYNVIHNDTIPVDTVYKQIN